VVVGEDDEISVGAGGDPALVGEAQLARDVGGEDRQEILKKDAALEQAADGVGEGCGAADVHGDDVTFRAEDRHTAGSVGGAGEALAWEVGAQVASDGFDLVEAVAWIFVRKGGDVDGDAAAGEIERFVEEAALTVDVGGMKGARRQLGGIEGASDEIEAAWAVPEVKVEDPSLAAHEAGDVGVAGDP
jgi:hypothetical protein